MTQQILVKMHKAVLCLSVFLGKQTVTSSKWLKQQRASVLKSSMSLQPAGRLLPITQKPCSFFSRPSLRFEKYMQAILKFYFTNSQKFGRPQPLYLLTYLAYPLDLTKGPWFFQIIVLANTSITIYNIQHQHCIYVTTDYLINNIFVINSSISGFSRKYTYMYIADMNISEQQGKKRIFF